MWKYPVFRNLIAFCFALASALPVANSAAEEIRKPVVSGQFYPASPEVLKKVITRYLDDAESKPDPGVRALVAPHAGYTYSGRMAGEAFNTVRDRRFDGVIVIGFSHRTSLSGIFVDNAAHYKTPLGLVPVDQAIAEKIRSHHKILQDKPRGDFQEHSVEVEVPFLQVAIPDLKIIPIYMGMQTLESARILAEAMTIAMHGRNMLVVVSSDCSHYHPYAAANKIDEKLIKLYEEGDIASLVSAYDNKSIEACGMGPMLTLLYMQKEMGWSKPKLIGYENSGDVTGDHARVVGYASFALKDDGSTSNPEPSAAKTAFSAEEHKELLRYSRQILEAHFDKSKSEPELTIAAAALNENRGVFVTINKEGGLRGCIGRIIARQPLRKNLKAMTLAAALQDHRFLPLSAEELDAIDIHISVLTDPQPVNSYKDVRLGIDGIIVSKGYKSGVFLPEVATDTGWDQRTFFTRCAFGKAGLSPVELDQAQIQVFQTESFGESKH